MRIFIFLVLSLFQVALFGQTDEIINSVPIIVGSGNPNSATSEINSIDITIEGNRYLDTLTNTYYDYYDDLEVGEKWVVSSDTQVRYVDDYAAMRSETDDVDEYQVRDDLLFGQFVKINAGVDDGGVIIVRDDGQAYKRLYSGGINPNWFGAIPDLDKLNLSGTNSSVAIQKAVNFADIYNSYVEFSGGEYLAYNINLPSDVLVKMNGALILNPVRTGNAGANNVFNVQGSLSGKSTNINAVPPVGSATQVLGNVETAYHLIVNDASQFQIGDDFYLLHEESAGLDSIGYNRVVSIKGGTAQDTIVCQKYIQKNWQVGTELVGINMVKNVTIQDGILVGAVDENDSFGGGGSGVSIKYADNININKIEGYNHREVGVKAEFSHQVSISKTISHSNNFFGFQFDRIQNLQISEMQTYNNGRGGLLYTGSNNIICDNFKIENNGKFVGNGDNVTLSNCENVKHANGIIGRAMCYGAWTLGYAKNISWDDVDVIEGNTGGFNHTQGVSDISYQNCTVEGNASGFIFDFTASQDTFQNIRIANCRVLNNKQYGVLGGGFKGVSIVDNSFYGNAAGNLRIGSSSRVKVSDNNFIDGNAQPGAGIIQPMSLYSVCDNLNMPSGQQNCESANFEEKWLDAIDNTPTPNRIWYQNFVGVGENDPNRQLHITSGSSAGAVFIENTATSMAPKSYLLDINGESHGSNTGNAGAFIAKVINDKFMHYNGQGKLGMNVDIPVATFDISDSNQLGLLKLKNTSGSLGTNIYTLDIDNSSHGSNATFAGSFRARGISDALLSFNGHGQLKVKPRAAFIDPLLVEDVNLDNSITEIWGQTSTGLLKKTDKSTFSQNLFQTLTNGFDASQLPIINLQALTFSDENADTETWGIGEAVGGNIDGLYTINRNTVTGVERFVFNDSGAINPDDIVRKDDLQNLKDTVQISKSFHPRSFSHTTGTSDEYLTFSTYDSNYTPINAEFKVFSSSPTLTEYKIIQYNPDGGITGVETSFTLPANATSVAVNNLPSIVEGTSWVLQIVNVNITTPPTGGDLFLKVSK